MKYRILVLVFSLSVLSVAFLSSAFAGDFAFVDLEPFANSKIVDTSWWTAGAGSSDLEELYEIAQDGYEFEEGPDGEPVEFKVVDAILSIFGTNSAANPVEIEGIEVGLGGEAVYFLHTTGWESPGAPGYKFVINYDGGTSEELLIESHINSDDWCHIPAQLTDDGMSAQVWTEGGVTCGSVSVIATKWANPHPGSTINTIDFVSLETPAVPGLFAISIGEPTASVSSEGKLTCTWAGLKADMEL